MGGLSRSWSAVLVTSTVTLMVTTARAQAVGVAEPVVSLQGAVATAQLTATRRTPFGSDVTIDDSGRLVLKAPPAGKRLDLAPNGAFVGNLFKGSDVARVYVSGKPETTTPGVWLLPVRLAGVGHPGDYKGTLSPSRSGDLKQATRIELKVTDWWIWPLLAVLLGAAISALPQIYIRRWRIEGKLHDRHRAFEPAYEKAERSFRQHFAHWEQIKRPSREDVERYAGVVDDAIRSYAKSTWYFDTTSSGYMKILTSIEIVERDAGCLGAADGLGKSLDDLVTARARLADFIGEDFPVDRPPAIALAASAFLRRGRLAVGEATTRAATAKDYVDLIKRWREMARAVRRYEVWCSVFESVGVPTKKNLSPEEWAQLREANGLVQQAKNELLDAGDAQALDRLGTEAHLEGTYSRLGSLGGQHRVWVVPGSGDDAQGGAHLETWIDGEQVPLPETARESLKVLAEVAPEYTTGTTAWTENAAPLEVSPATAVELGQTKRFVGDAMVVILAAASGMVTALTGFYFGKTFGTWVDYVTVIFVGTAGQAFLKPVMDALIQFRGSGLPAATSDPMPATTTVGVRA